MIITPTKTSSSTYIQWLQRAQQNFAQSITRSLALPPARKKNVAYIVAAQQQYGTIVNINPALSFSSIAGRHHRSRLPPLPPKVPPATAPASAACRHSRLSPPVVAIDVRRQPPPAAASRRLNLIIVSESSSLPPAALPPPRSQISSRPLNAATAIERSCRHQTSAIFVVHRRRQAPPPAVSPPPPPPSIAIFVAVASPPPRRSPSPRPSNARRPLSRLCPSPTPSNAIAHRHHHYAVALWSTPPPPLSPRFDC